MRNIIDNKLHFLYDLIHCSYKIPYWVYGADKEVLDGPSNMKVIERVFEKNGCRDHMIEYGRNHSAPLILSAPMGLIWSAAFEKEDGELKRIHVMGPVKVAEVSPDILEKTLNQRDISLVWKRELMNVFKEIPIVATTQFFQYAIMQHYCITGVSLSISDLHYQQREFKEIDIWGPREKRDRKNTYLVEQELLYMVRTGNMNYRKVLDKASGLSTGVRMKIGDPLRQAKNSVIIFTSLCVRAAIKGGIPSDSSYARGDAYIESIENSTTISEVSNISHMMYEDFIGCVHKQRINPNYSKEIVAVCEYIGFHVAETIQISELAQLVGYADYYLTRKFKQEVGISISEYIRIAKINQAKMMLVTSDDSVSEICEKLSISSRGHFIENFKMVTGCTPKEFREKEKYY